MPGGIPPMLVRIYTGEGLTGIGASRSAPGLPAHLEVLFDGIDPADRQPGDPIMYILPVDAYQRMWDRAGNPAVRKKQSCSMAWTAPALRRTWRRWMR